MTGLAQKQEIGGNTPIGQSIVSGVDGLPSAGHSTTTALAGGLVLLRDSAKVHVMPAVGRRRRHA